MKSLKESNNIQSKEFGDWAVVFWKKGSKTLSIAQNQGDPGTTDFWMVGTTTRQFDYESGWLPNKKWSTAIKGHFSKDKAIQMAKEQAMKDLKESRINIPNKFSLSLEESAGFVKNENVYDFTNLDEDENTFDTIIKEFNLMELSREEIESLGLDISVQNSVVGVYGSYVSGNGTPDVIVYDFEISGRQRPYKYTINVVQMQEYARAEKYFYIISSRLSQMLDDQSKGLKEGCLDHIKDKWQKVQESRKPFTSDIPNNLLEIQNNMEDVFTIHNLSIATSESANGLTRDILTSTGTKVGELSFTPASYYMAGPREDIYWEGSTLEEFEADVADLAYTL